MGSEGGRASRGDRTRTWLGLERDEESSFAPETERPPRSTVDPGPLNIMWTIVAGVAALWLVISVGVTVWGLVVDGFDWSGLANFVLQSVGLALLTGFAISRTRWGGPWFDRPLQAGPR